MHICFIRHEDLNGIIWGLQLAGGDSSDDELFAPRSGKAGASSAGDVQSVDVEDHSRFTADGTVLASWAEEGAVEGLRNRFVTGAQRVPITC